MFYSPSNCEELFNLRHASACNAVEHAFGIIKWRFRILLLPVEFPLNIQARLPAALCTLHNFTSTHDNDNDSSNNTSDNTDSDSQDNNNETPGAEPVPNDDITAKQMHDNIAQAMWDGYMHILRECAQVTMGDSDVEDVESEADSSFEMY